MTSSVELFEIDSRSDKNHKLPTKTGCDIVSSSEYVIKIIETLKDTDNYSFIIDICELTNDIIIQTNKDFSTINIKFLFNDDNQVIIGIKPYLSLKCIKNNKFKSIKDKIKFEKAKCIFLQKNSLI